MSEGRNHEALWTGVSRQKSSCGDFKSRGNRPVPQMPVEDVSETAV